MAEMAGEYHEQLLIIDRDPGGEPEEEKLGEVLWNTTAKLSPENVSKLREGITEEEVAAAVTSTVSGKAAGMDGIPVELWKLLHQQSLGARMHLSRVYMVITL